MQHLAMILHIIGSIKGRFLTPRKDPKNDLFFKPWESTIILSIVTPAPLEAYHRKYSFVVMFVTL
jgi:hypothetical protein